MLAQNDFANDTEMEDAAIGAWNVRHGSRPDVYTEQDQSRDRKAAIAMDLSDPKVSGTDSEREGA
jgi:hypothetical protein